MENVDQTNTVMKRFKKHVLPHIMEMQGAIAGIVKQGIEQGEFRPVDPRSAAVMYMSAFRAELLSGGRCHSTRPGESIQELFFCGILADDKGRRTNSRKK
jgi:hypothetical protein